MFKKDWEHPYSEKSLPPKDILEAMMAQGVSDFLPESFDILRGGNRNLNLRVHGKNGSSILRLYLSDPTAGVREKNIYELLKNHLPVPEVFYTGVLEDITFSIQQDMPGISLRDLLLNHKDPNFHIMEKVGKILNTFQKFPLEHTGFFDEELNINMMDYPVEIKKYSLQSLEMESIQKFFTKEILNALTQRINNTDFSILADHPHFTHGDFGPENILVIEGKNGWEISAILDTEFSFSGSYLQDIANMMRYAHKMPKAFQTQFLNGLSMTLPDNWENMTATLNILSLLDILRRRNPKEHPKTCRDIHALVTHFIDT